MRLEQVCMYLSFVVIITKIWISTYSDKKEEKYPFIMDKI